MASRKISISSNPVANNYACSNERIIEFSSPQGGGLIAFTLTEDRLTVDVYRQDKTVTVRVGKLDS